MRNPHVTKFDKYKMHVDSGRGPLLPRKKQRDSRILAFGSTKLSSVELLHLSVKLRDRNRVEVTIKTKIPALSRA